MLANQIWSAYTKKMVPLVGILEICENMMISISNIQFEEGDIMKAERAKKYSNIIRNARKQIMRVK